MTSEDPPSMFGDEEDLETSVGLDAAAEADCAAGRVVPHTEVVKWLESWGTTNELPCPIPSMFPDEEDPETEARLDAEAEAAIAAGQVVAHQRVLEWLEKLCRGERVPPPKA